MRVDKATFEAFEALVAQAVYGRELDKAVRECRRILSHVGCTVTKRGCYVSFNSSRTGSHTLNMSYGVRRVSDLTIHAQGFAEQQTHVKA